MGVVYNAEDTKLERTVRNIETQEGNLCAFDSSFIVNPD